MANNLTTTAVQQYPQVAPAGYSNPANSVQPITNSGGSTSGTMFGAAIGGAFNMINSGLAAIYNKHQQKRAINYARESEDRQNYFNIEAEKRNLQYQKDLIDYVNDYNDPSAQMQRYADAGLNPYLVDVENGNMTQPASVQATPTQAQNGFEPHFVDDFGIDKAALAGAQYSLEKKKLAFENEKIDLARRQFARDMYEDDRDFVYNQKMQEARDQFDRSMRLTEQQHRAREISLMEYKQQRDDAHTAFEEARESAADLRAAAKHGLDMRIGNLEYNKSEEEYREVWPEQKRLKVLQAKYDSLLLDLTGEQREKVKAYMDASLELRQKVVDNEITLQDYETELRMLWNGSRGKLGRFSNSSLFMNNPFEEARGKSSSVLGKIADIALKMLK